MYDYFLEDGNGYLSLRQHEKMDFFMMKLNQLQIGHHDSS